MEQQLIGQQLIGQQLMGQLFMGQLLINDNFTFIYDNKIYNSKIIYYNNTIFIIATPVTYNRMVFTLVVDENNNYFIKLIFITNTHGIKNTHGTKNKNGVKNKLKNNKILFYNSHVYQYKLLNDDINSTIDNFTPILNNFVMNYLHKTVDDIFLNLMYFYLTNYNRTYILCLCALNNDMNNFHIILNNIKVNTKDLLYTLQHTFGYLPMSSYNIYNKQLYFEYYRQLQHLKYIPEYNYLNYDEFIILIYNILQTNCT
jgi:hypothetical protein